MSFDAIPPSVGRFIWGSHHLSNKWKLISIDVPIEPLKQLPKYVLFHFSFIFVLFLFTQR